MVDLSLSLPDDLVQRLERLARRTGRSKTFYVLEAIVEHLDDIEDVYLAEQRLARLHAGESEAVPLEDVLKRYGMDNQA